MPVAAISTRSWPEIVRNVEEYLGEDLLLHAAVSSGSVSMVTLILDLHDMFKYSPYPSFCRPHINASNLSNNDRDLYSDQYDCSYAYGMLSITIKDHSVLPIWCDARRFVRQQQLRGYFGVEMAFLFLMHDTEHYS